MTVTFRDRHNGPALDWGKETMLLRQSGPDSFTFDHVSTIGGVANPIRSRGTCTVANGVMRLDYQATIDGKLFRTTGTLRQQ